VIGTATIRCELDRVPVLGVRHGFQWLMQGDGRHVVPLGIDDVSRIHFRGGSCIGTSRANPTKDAAHLDNVVRTLLELGVGGLITIGGDDTAYSAMRVEEAAKGRILVVHVPKTIDNDLCLPPTVDTFGFQTARHVGVQVIENLMVDAETTTRWYFAVAMGRKAGHLALGIGKAAGTTLTLIPEEFVDGEISFRRIVDTLTGSIIKRIADGDRHGIAVIAEGVVLGIGPEELAEISSAERDEHGHVRIAEIPLGLILKAAVQRRLRELGLKMTIVSKNIGYELRCADPIPFDMEYTRDLGFCAARYLLDGGTGAMVTIQGGTFVPMPFHDLLDPHTGKTRVRLVDIESAGFGIARKYMIRLERSDFEGEAPARLGAVCGLSADEFRRQFQHVVEAEPELPPVSWGS